MTRFSENSLVLVHGFLSGSDYWRKQYCLNKHANLVFIELPGYGRVADQPPCESIQAFAKSALSQIDRRNINQFDLIGHSMGGMIAQEMVNMAPARVNKLILFGTGPIGDIPGRFEPIDTSLAKANESSYQTEMQTAVASWFLNYKESEDFEDAVTLAMMASFSAYYNGLNAMKNWQNLENLSSINQETLILWGDKDRSYNLEQQRLLWTNIPDSHLSVIANSAHNTHLEKPKLFNEIVCDFLYGIR